MIGPICAFLSSCTWAIGSSKYAQVAQHHTPFAVNFTRALLAFPLFVLAALIWGGLPAFEALRWHHLGWFTLSMICSYGVADVLFIWSTRSLGVPGALAIASTYPLMTALGSFLSGGDGLRGAQWLGLVAIVGGVVVVVLNAPSRDSGGAHSGGEGMASAWNDRRWGVVMALTTAAFWAGNTYAVARGGADLSAPVGNAVRMMMAMGISFGLGRLVAPGTPYRLDWSTLRPALWIFVLEAFGGSLFFMYGLANSPLVLGSALTSLAPVIAVPVAITLGLEKPSFYRTLGVAVVVCGLWFLTASGG